MNERGRYLKRIKSYSQTVSVHLNKTGQGRQCRLFLGGLGPCLTPWVVDYAHWSLDEFWPQPWAVSVKRHQNGPSQFSIVPHFCCSCILCPPNTSMYLCAAFHSVEAHKLQHTAGFRLYELKNIQDITTTC